MSLILADKFIPIYEKLLSELPHALLLVGKPGVGLHSIASTLAVKHGELVLLAPASKTKGATPIISVDEIRSVYEAVRSHRPQVVIVDDADSMTPAAQNAFLKLLEEPNASTSFILTSHAHEKLLSTIRSRARSVLVPNPDATQVRKLLDSAPADATTKTQLQFIAGNKPAELTRLINDVTYFTARKQAIGTAKQLIEQPLYHCFVMLSKQKFDRISALQLIVDMIELLERTRSQRSIKRITPLLEAHENISRGGNPRLQLSAAML